LFQQATSLTKANKNAKCKANEKLLLNFYGCSARFDQGWKQELIYFLRYLFSVRSGGTRYLFSLGWKGAGQPARH